ncbi:MAG TPA: DUF3459 domain-containing protein, partial [Hyphomonadaceae bacterium]|nr:DUF3459 domain-containing protein [Hyphomonadaceae bacterium]
DKLQDPWGVAGWPATKGRDGCRTPMPWSDAANAGFSKAKETWLPVDPRQRALSAEKQEKLVDSTLAITRKLIALRKASAALGRGAFRVIEASATQLVFERTAGADRVIAAFNFGKTQVTTRIEGGLASVMWANEAVLSDNTLTLAPLASAWIRVQG